MAYCRQCGNQIDDTSVFCPKCGANQTVTVNNNYYNVQGDSFVSSKSRLIALILCVVLGEIGVHRFYAGKIGTGLLWLFTGGVFGIGWLIDIIMIACGSFKDAEGKFISNWNV